MTLALSASLRATSVESTRWEVRMATSICSAIRSTSLSSSCSDTLTCGYSAVNSASSGASGRRAAIEHDTRSRPRTCCWYLSVISPMRSSACSICCACCSTSAPISVSARRRVERWIRRAPRSSSSRASWRDTTDLPQPSWMAAALMLPARTMAAKMASRCGLRTAPL